MESRLAVPRRSLLSSSADPNEDCRWSSSTVSTISSRASQSGTDRQQSSHEHHRALFRRLFGRKNRPSAAAPGSLTNPRSLPRSLASVPFVRTLHEVWETGSETDAGVKFSECFLQVNTVRRVRVLKLADASNGVAITIEVSLEQVASGGMVAAVTRRTLSRSFADCSHLLKLLSLIAKSSLRCSCESNLSSRASECEWSANMRRFVSTCWVQPALVNPHVLQLCGAQRMRAGVLEASLNDIISLVARNELDDRVKVSSTDKPRTAEQHISPLQAGSRLPRLSSVPIGNPKPTATCRAQLEAAAVVRDFLLSGS